MNTLLHRLPLVYKFVLALVLPLLATAYFGLAGILERMDTMRAATGPQATTALAQQAAALLHELQRERGYSSGHVVTKDGRIRPKLDAQRVLVDKQREQFTVFVNQADPDLIGSALLEQARALLPYFAETVGMRNEINERKISSYDVVRRYTELISELIKLIDTATGFGSSDAGVRTPAVYNVLIRLKETAGIERAVITAALNADTIYAEVYERLAALEADERTYYKMVELVGESAVRERLAEAYSSGELQRRISEIRSAITLHGDVKSIDPFEWFDLKSRQIGLVKEVEDEMTNALIARAGEMHAEARAALISYLAVVVLSAVLASIATILIARSILSPLARTLRVLGSDQNNLTRRLDVPGSDEFSRLNRAFNDSLASTEQLVSSIRRTAQSVGIASREIAQGNDDLASRTEQQSTALVEIASSLEEITATVRNTADHARSAQAVSSEVAAQADEATRVSTAARAAMQRIHEANQRVTSIVAAIDSIAFQTNLLALNASVEAARAGEHGRGFAVVAAEVRKLSSRSANEAEQIRNLVADNVASINEGQKLVATTGETLEAIAVRVKQMATQIAEISTAADEQSAGIGQINQAVSQLEQMIQQNAALVEETAAASQSLDDQVADMSDEIDRFKVSDEISAHHPAAADTETYAAGQKLLLSGATA